jgi:hypothetical protein
VFEEEKLLIFKNSRFQINANFKNNYVTNIPNNCKKCCDSNNNEINFNYKNNYNFSENNTSFAYSDYSKIDNKEINQELNLLKNLLNKNYADGNLNKEKIGNLNTNKLTINYFYLLSVIN